MRKLTTVGTTKAVEPKRLNGEYLYRLKDKGISTRSRQAYVRMTEQRC